MADLFGLLLDPKTATMKGLLDGKRPARNIYEEKWAEYHKKYPYVYRLFCDFSNELINRGFKNGSAHMIIMRLRWETMKPYDDHNPATGDPLKISNGQFPYFSRLFMEEHPWHEGFFRTKKVKITNANYKPWPDND